MTTEEQKEILRDSALTEYKKIDDAAYEEFKESKKKTPDPLYEKYKKIEKAAYAKYEKKIKEIKARE